jgi:hypothetical protein
LFLSEIRKWLKQPSVAKLVISGSKTASAAFMSDSAQNESDAAADKAVGLRKLHPPCVKISDMRNCHRPLFREKMDKKTYFGGR